jgi:hypothetical protein
MLALGTILAGQAALAEAGQTALTAGAPEAIFYVALNGNDSWSGTLPTPNPTHTDGPFATFNQARLVVQSLNKAGLGRVVVQFRAGTYFLRAIATLTAADAGTPSTEIVYENYPGESPVISGGMRVGNWTNVGGNVWTTTLPATTQYFEQLFYNGQRRLRPRLGTPQPSPSADGQCDPANSSCPDLGAYFRFVGPVYLSAAQGYCSVYVPGSGYECFDRFQYDPTDPITNTWRNLAPPAGNPCGQPAGNPALAGDIEVLDFEKYTASKLRISCVDSVADIVYLTGPTAISPAPYTFAHGFIANHRYLVENIQDQLEYAGQWFLDRSTSPWTLTYLAQKGEDPNADSVVIPQLGQVLVANGLQYVEFQGLTFEHDNYTLPYPGHADVELAPDIPAAVSFQNSQHITFDSGVVAQTSGAGLEFISCLDAQSPAWCLFRDTSAVTADNVVRNSAFYDLGDTGVRIGIQLLPADTDANVPQFITFQNNVIEGYGRVFPNADGVTQGEAHDITYTHNDIYDGYHAAILVCDCSSLVPNGNGAFNNTISFNHVYNLLQGIMNDGGSLYFDTGNVVSSAAGSSIFIAAGNKMLNNKVHDVSDASALDGSTAQTPCPAGLPCDGYGGHGIYLDTNTGLVDVENNLVYRVSGNAVNFNNGPAAPNAANTIKNNILAFARLSMIYQDNPFYSESVPPSPIQAFLATNNLFYFDRNSASSPLFYVQGGCTYSGGVPYPEFQLWNSNLYWRTDGAFASDPEAFHVQPNPGAITPCTGNTSDWTFYTFAGWQVNTGEDAQSVVHNPGFRNPAYPADDYSLPKGSPGVGFVVFDPKEAGRSNPMIFPPPVRATFLTKSFNPETDF